MKNSSLLEIIVICLGIIVLLNITVAGCIVNIILAPHILAAIFGCIILGGIGCVSALFLVRYLIDAFRDCYIEMKQNVKKCKNWLPK